MKIYLKSFLATSILLIISFVTSAQARLTIENNSMRYMTVKVMKGYNGKGSLFQTVSIDANSSETIYFSNGGYYFTKTKAVIRGKDPLYRRGQPFEVTNNSTGYSVLTLTYSIKESAIPQASGGKSISKAEFDEN